MNISLALSINNSKKNILPFLESYSKYSTGTLYLITDIDNDIQGYSNIIPINFVNFCKQYKVPTQLTAFNLKPILFYLFLKNKQDINNVLITDVDVIFQNDPFKSELSNCM